MQKIGPKLLSILVLGPSCCLALVACAQEIQDPRFLQLKEAFASQIGSIDIHGSVVSEDGQLLNDVSIDYFFREFGDVVADKAIEYENLRTDGDFRIKREKISSVNIWIYKRGYYSKRWSYSFDADVPRSAPEGYERIDLEIVLEKQPVPAILNTFKGILRADIAGPISVVEVKRKGNAETWLLKDGERREIVWPHIFLVGIPEGTSELRIVQFRVESQRQLRDGLEKGLIRLSDPDRGDGFVVFDPGKVPARPEIAMRGMNTAPVSGYRADLEVSAAESPSKVYFFCKINGQYGKGMVSGRPMIAEENGRQVARALILVYLNPTGSRDVAHIHN